MLIENNPRIDFAELTKRLLALAATMPAEPPQQHSVLPSGTLAPASVAPAPPPTSPGTLQKIGQWLVCIVRLRRTREWALLARAQGTALEGRIDSLEAALARAKEAAIAEAEHRRSLERSLADTKRGLAASAGKRDLDELRRELMFQQRRLNRLVAPAAALPGAIAADTADGRLDALYLAFEDRFRGTRSEIKARLAANLQAVTGAGAGAPEHPILDLGCGRGEWLELLAELHLTAYGVDGNAMMVERARSAGLDARKEDLFAHLRALPDACRSAVTAFHVVEHLPFPRLIDMLDEILRVLIPGGLLLLETPNPETMRVGATTFYYDPTHQHPLPPLPLAFMVEHRGFVDVETVKRHPFTEGLLEAGTPDAALLNRVLFGPQDYAILARRP